jgi:transposase, IS30 family
MPKGYRHLTYDKRCQIYALLKSGCAKTEIAQLIGVHRSTITKELKRNTGRKGYRYLQAQEKASARRAAASGAPRKMKPGLIREIEDKLTQDQWSPDQISGWLKTQGRACVSGERIYRHIWKDKRNGGELWRHLRHSGKKYNRRKGKTSGRGLIPGRVDIAERPAIAAEKRRIGDWEGDAIIGRSLKGAILTHVDRTSKYTKLAILPDKSAASVQKACDASLLPIAHKVETITYDNGKEFAGHAQIAAKLGAHIYFAKPYHACERGLNEHTNGLVRQYFPKGSDFSTLTPADVQRVEDKLNARPRKALGYKTPSEVFFAAA